MFFALDATCASDQVAPNGVQLPAALIRQVTAAKLEAEFAAVVSTDQLIVAVEGAPRRVP